MYSIIMIDGEIINIKATEIEWYEKSRIIRLINDKMVVAQINMDNVIGWIDLDYKAESEN